MKFNHIWVYIVISFASLVTVNAQEPILDGYIPVDSLKNKDYQTLTSYFDRTVSNSSIKPDSIFAYKVAMTYLWIAHQKNDSLYMGKAYSMLSQLDNYRLDYLDRSITYTNKYKDKNQPAVAYSLKFVNYYYNGNYKKASKMLLKAIQYARERNNTKLLYELEYNITILNSQWGDKNQVAKEIEKHLVFMRSPEFNSMFVKYSNERKKADYVDTQYNLSKSLYQVEDYKKASIYLDSVYNYGIENNTNEYILNYLGLKGGILYREKKYQEALVHTNRYLEENESDDLYGDSRSLNMKGLTLWELNRKKEAIQSIKKADSLYQITDDEFEELGEGYQLLINYYEEVEDTDNQLLYLNKLIEFDRKISSNYIEIGNRIEQEYTIPQLLAEKDKVILKLNQEKSSEQRSKYFIIIVLVISVLIIVYYVRKNYLNKKRFKTLQERFKEQKTTIETLKKVPEKEKVALDLDEKQILLISKGLTQFEKSHGFLDSTVTLKSLSEILETNSSYLSKYINGVKETNFTTYISDLRIRYAIHKLQEDAKFRSYTIEAIASDVGFSNTRSFTNHFKRITGITVSYFIKKLSSSS